MKTGGAEYGLDEAKMQGFVEQLNPTETHSTCLRLGDLVILGVPGEMATELGMEIKSKAREFTHASSVAIGGLADEWVSYILSAEEYRKGDLAAVTDPRVRDVVDSRSILLTSVGRAFAGAKT